MESSYSSAVPMETDAMAQFLGGAHDHCYESMEAMAAMFLPGLHTDSNSNSSGCLNYDVSPQCWPQPGHCSSVTSFLDPSQSYDESFEFPVIDSFPHAGFVPHCAAAVPYFGEHLSPLHGDHSSAVVEEEEAAAADAPVTNKRKSSAAMKGSKKAKKSGKKDYVSLDEGGDGYIDPQSSSSCTSEEGNLEGGNAKSSTKKTGTRARRGGATDPQSLYARKRRERINERLRILQNLVPNGTKVDISTMLEEAVEYVKFMKLQIKLLSSDDMWMYAPIAYNGINIGSLDLNMSAMQK